MSRPLIPKGGNDRVYTPYHLARLIVRHFAVKGKVLEPCRGRGAFFSAIREVTAREPDWCELDKEVLVGVKPRDFLTHDFNGTTYDWILTNPPYSQILDFLKRSMDLANHVVFLVQATVPDFTAKQRLMVNKGFEVREVFRVPTPPEWPAKTHKFGTGLAAVHWQRGYVGPVQVTRARGWKKGFTLQEVVAGGLIGLLGLAVLLRLGQWLG